MKRMSLISYGETNNALAEALIHAAQMIRLGTPSENITWDDRSHVSFDVHESTDEEFNADTGSEEE